jgi:hypothetical protein
LIAHRLYFSTEVGHFDQLLGGRHGGSCAALLTLVDKQLDKHVPMAVEACA